MGSFRLAITLLCMLTMKIHSLSARENDDPELIESSNNNRGPTKAEDGSAALAPPTDAQAKVAAEKIMNCDQVRSPCDEKEVKAAVKNIKDNGYKIKLKGKNYGPDLVLTFHPNTSIPTVVKAPKNFSMNSEAFLSIAKAAEIPSGSSNTISNNSANNLQNANVGNREVTSTQTSSVGKSSSTAHGGAQGYFAGAKGESLLSQSSLTQAQQQIKQDINSVPSSLPNELLSSDTRSLAVDSMITTARNSISMPVGASNLSTNPLYGKVLSDKNDKNIDSNLQSLVRKDLEEKNLKSNFNDLKSIALSASFQENAGKLIGDQKLKDFNLATIGAEILMENDSTFKELLGINKSLGSPFDKTIAKYNINGAQNIASISSTAAYAGVTSILSYNPEDWIEISRNLSNPDKRMLRPLNFDMAKAAEGRKSLELLLVDLKSLNSLDLLNAVTVPMGDFIVTWTKDARERILLSLLRMKKISSEDPHVDENPAVIENFKSKALALQKELLETNTMALFFNKFLDFYTNPTNNLIWKKYSPSNYLEANRSLSLIRFSLAFNGLRKKYYDDLPNEPLAYLTLSSFNVLTKERVRKQRELNKQKQEDSLRLANGKSD